MNYQHRSLNSQPSVKLFLLPLEALHASPLLEICEPDIQHCLQRIQTLMRCDRPFDSIDDLENLHQLIIQKISTSHSIRTHSVRSHSAILLEYRHRIIRHRIETRYPDLCLLANLISAYKAMLSSDHHCHLPETSSHAIALQACLKLLVRHFTERYG